MRRPMQKTKKTTHLIQVIVLLSILVTIQFYVAVLNYARADYFGIQFGNENQVKIDGANDVWQLEKVRYTYIAKNQTKPEVDLLGLHIKRNASSPIFFFESQKGKIPSSNKKIDLNNSYIFSIPMGVLINVSYTIITNISYSNSFMEFYNWTWNKFNSSKLMNQSTFQLLSQDFYKNNKILVHFNISHSQDFTFWYNLTYEFWYKADQVISIQFAALTAGENSLVNHLRMWIFLDTDGDNKSNYAIQWIYGNSTILYQIDKESFTLEVASGKKYWNGTFGKYWTGMDWRWDGVSPKELGTIDSGNRMVNSTLPSFAVNLTAKVSYAVWAQKIEADYDWWDSLPDDPNWELTRSIPGFQWLFLGLGLLFVIVIFLRRIVFKGKWI